MNLMGDGLWLLPAELRRLISDPLLILILRIEADKQNKP